MHRHLPRAAIAILAVTGLIGAAPARADWSAPETIALSGAGSGLSSLQFALDNGVAAAIWNENSSTARAAFRPFGGPFGSTQTLDTENLVYEPSVAVGPSGQAIAAWGFKNNTGPVQAIEYADRDRACEDDHAPRPPARADHVEDAHRDGHDLLIGGRHARLGAASSTSLVERPNAGRRRAPRDLP